MAKFFLFLGISLLFHTALLFSLGQSNIFERLNLSSFSKRSGKSSIKARLVVQEKVKKLPKTGKKKRPAPKKKQKAGQSRVEDRSKKELESGSDEMLAQYLSEIRELILKNKFKGPIASRLGLTGTSKISFTIESPNRLKEIKVTKSSGKKPLDESALESVRRVRAMPSIPSELGLKEITISLEMEFE